MVNPDPSALSESMLTALAADERVLSTAERDLIRSIVSRVTARHGQPAARTVVAAVGDVVGRRLVGQLGLAVAARVTDGLLDLAPLEPGPGNPDPFGPPPAFPDPERIPPPPPPSPPPPPPVQAPPPLEIPLPPMGVPGFPFPVFPADPPTFFPTAPSTPFSFPMGPFGFPHGPSIFDPGQIDPGFVDPDEISPEIFGEGTLQIVPVIFTVLNAALDEDDVTAVRAWAADHRDAFVAETTLAAADVLDAPADADAQPAQALRVLDDLGDLGERIAGRIRSRLGAAAGASVSLRLIEMTAGRGLTLPAAASRAGIGLVLPLGEVSADLPLRIHDAQQAGGVIAAGNASVKVLVQSNQAVVFPAVLSAESAHVPGEPAPPGDDAPVLVIIGHLGA